MIIQFQGIYNWLRVLGYKSHIEFWISCIMSLHIVYNDEEGKC